MVRSSGLSSPGKLPAIHLPAPHPILSLPQKVYANQSPTPELESTRVTLQFIPLNSSPPSDAPGPETTPPSAHSDTKSHCSNDEATTQQLVLFFPNRVRTCNPADLDSYHIQNAELQSHVGAVPLSSVIPRVMTRRTWSPRSPRWNRSQGFL